VKYLDHTKYIGKSSIHAVSSKALLTVFAPDSEAVEERQVFKRWGSSVRRRRR